MPNWCENKLKICGKKKDREDMLTFVSITIPAKKNGAIANNIPGEHIPFTFNRIIPYPQKFRDLDEECDKKRTELEAMSESQLISQLNRAELIEDSYVGWNMANTTKKEYLNDIWRRLFKLDSETREVLSSPLDYIVPKDKSAEPWERAK